ncbi:MAG: type II toxin-antitoxin system HicA family toxin [Nitrospirae bacterium YQR-1]
MKDLDFIKLIKKHGWELDRTAGSHHIYKKGNDSISIPVHKKDLKSGTLHQLLKDSGLSLNDIKKGKKKTS